MSHTPGPWNIYYNNPRSIVVRKINEGGYEVSHMATVHSGAQDALIIAAAPELLEALESMVEMVEMNGFGKAYAMDIARAAIAKARGSK